MQFKYKILMIKMKIAYMAWSQDTEVQKLFFRSINLTIKHQQQKISEKIKALDKVILKYGLSTGNIEIRNSKDNLRESLKDIKVK